MRVVRTVNRTRDAALADHTTVTDSFLNRGWGLLGHSTLPEGEGMIITKTNCIHSMFMRFPFDAIYVDKRGVACGLLEEFPPFRFGPLIWRGDCVVELPAGTIRRTGTQLGDEIVFEPLAPDADKAGTRGQEAERRR